MVQTCVHFELPHAESAAVAAQKIKKAIAESRSQLKEHAEDLEERWEGNTLHFGASLQGKRITGTLEVKDKLFIVDAKLPLMWRLFEGRIESMIKEQSKHLLQ